MMELAQRKRMYRLIQVGLVAAAIAIVAIWFTVKRSSPMPDVADFRVEAAPAGEALGPGDVQIFSRDSAVTLILKGDQILAGLSPKTVAKVRAEIEASSKNDDTTKLGGSIAQLVKRTVAEKIATHVAYPLSEISDIRYDDGEIVIERHGRGNERLFSSTKVNREPLSKSFSPEDARRFVEAVRARMSATTRTP
jgi:hypothetical protein